MRLILLSTLLTMILVITSCNRDYEDIFDVIDVELQLHPKATLLDIYKNFFQGEFGPGHMIPSREAAMEYLDEELAETTEFDTVLFQPVGIEEKYYRVNLSLITDSLITKEQLLNVFVSGQDSTTQMSLEDWKWEWNFIYGAVWEIKADLPGLKKDGSFIYNNLRNGIIVGHHSKIFKETYHPHYRLVPAEKVPELREIIKQRLKNK